MMQGRTMSFLWAMLFITVLLPSSSIVCMASDSHDATAASRTDAGSDVVCLCGLPCGQPCSPPTVPSPPPPLPFCPPPPPGEYPWGPPPPVFPYPWSSPPPGLPYPWGPPPPSAVYPVDPGYLPSGACRCSRTVWLLACMLAGFLVLLR